MFEVTINVTDRQKNGQMDGTALFFSWMSTSSEEQYSQMHFCSVWH